MKSKYKTVEVEAQIVSSDRIPVNGDGEEFGRGWQKNTETVKRRYKIKKLTEADRLKKKGYERIKPGTMASLLFPGKKYVRIIFDEGITKRKKVAATKAYEKFISVLD